MVIRDTLLILHMTFTTAPSPGAETITAHFQAATLMTEDECMKHVTAYKQVGHIPLLDIVSMNITNAICQPLIQSF